jgi:O-antigen/teichoic acid export membrane protein
MSSFDLTLQRAQWLSRWGVVASMRAAMLVCRFLLVLFISRYLDLASLGVFGLVTGAVAMTPAFVGLGLVHIIMRDAVTMTPTLLTDALRHYWSFTVALYVLLLPIAVATADALGWSPAWIAIVIAITLFEQIGNDIFQLLTNLERPVYAAFTAFLRGAAWILIFVPLAIYEPQFRTLQSLLVFWLAGSVSSFVAFAIASRTWPWRDAFKRPFRPSWLISRVPSSLIIYASDVSFIASQYIDRYFVTLFLGLKLAGVYMLYWTAASAMYTFVSVTILQQQRPLLIRMHHEGDIAFRRLCVRLMPTTVLATVFLGAMVAIAFEIVAPLLRQPLATENMLAFWLIVAGMCVRCIADWGAMALFSGRRDRIMTATNLAAVAALALVQSLLLPLLGLPGAGLAALVAFSAVTCWRLHLIFSRPLSCDDARQQTKSCVPPAGVDDCQVRSSS